MMFEIPTYEEILQRCLDRISDTIDKRQGSIIYDALAPAVAEISQLYIQLYGVSELVFIDTATGEYLDRLVQQNGVTRKSATKAIRKGVFSKEVPIGSRFSIADVTYVVISNITGFEYRLECEQAGAIGNEPFGTLTPISNIQGLTFATLQDIIQSGDDTESDASLVERFTESVLAPNFGGNVSDYQIKVKALEGVGGVKVVPIWDGPGTVELIITDSTWLSPSTALINSVQEAVDPTQDQTGLGIAPIGHKVTVVGAKSDSYRVIVDLVVQSGITPASLAEPINNTLSEYFSFLNSSWDSTENIIIRMAQIETRILAIEGVLDINSVALSKGSGNITSNIVLPSDTIAVYYADPIITVN